jgi:hypothetical protein
MEEFHEAKMNEVDKLVMWMADNEVSQRKNLWWLAFFSTVGWAVTFLLLLSKL